MKETLAGQGQSQIAPSSFVAPHILPIEWVVVHASELLQGMCGAFSEEENVPTVGKS